MTYSPSDPDNVLAGVPGTAGSLLVGEGAASTLDLVVYFYDASAPSGSRFTVVSDLSAANTMPKDSGDRVCFGVSSRFFWSILVDIGVASSGDAKFAGKYWDGAALATADLMALKESDSSHIGDLIFEAVQVESVTWDRDARTDWATADAELDEIPNTGVARYWMCFELLGGLTTAVRFDDIKVRGNDFALIGGGVPHPTYRGRARWEDDIDLVLNNIPALGSVPTVATAHGITTQIGAYVHQFSGNGDANLAIQLKIPKGIDTSCSARILIDGVWDAPNGVNECQIIYTFIKQGDVIGAGNSDATIIAHTFTPTGTDIAVLDIDFTVVRADRISLAACKPGDMFFAYIRREGLGDAGNSDGHFWNCRLGVIRYQHGDPT